jgi:hypothetical protein
MEDEVVHSSTLDGVHGETSGSTSSTALWGPIQVGNQALCTQNFAWDKVETIILHDGTRCDWSIEQHKQFHASFEPPMISFEPPMISFEPPMISFDMQLPMKFSSIANFANKAREIVRLMANLTTAVKENYVQFSRTALDEQSDSDDELMPDPEITPPFTEAEWKVIVKEFRELHVLYGLAVEHSFQNAHGKYFVEKFIKICSILDDNMYLYIRHGTSCSGDHQPGSCKWNKLISRAEPSTSRCSSVSTESTPPP